MKLSIAQTTIEIVVGVVVGMVVKTKEQLLVERIVRVVLYIAGVGK